MTSPAASVSVVVPATDRPRTLGRCLAALRGGAEPPDEIVVVDRPRGLGPAAARNAGAARARGEILVFVDADVEVHPDAVGRIRAAFGRESELTALFGSYDDSPAAPGAVSGFRNLLHHHVHQRAAGPATTFWAGFGSVRRDAFTAAGGFDAGRYAVPAVEDVELGLRLSARGGRLRLDPELLCTHLKAWTLLEMVRTDFARRGVPWVVLLLERRRGARALNLGPRHSASAVVSVAGAVATVAGRPRGAVAAVAALVLLNRSFYALVLARRGPREAAAAVPLHALHHLAAAAAVPAGLASYLRTRLSRTASGAADPGPGRERSSASSTASPSSR